MGPSITAGMTLATAAGRELEAATRPEAIEVLAPNRTPDGSGGSSVTWAAVATFQGRVSPSSKPAMVVVGGGPQPRQLWELTGPTGISVATTARLRANGVTYAVVADDEPRSYSVASHILCYEVT